jgi:hypothetical protein
MMHSSFSGRHKKDGYHDPAVKLLLAYGFSVRDRSKAGGGIPDLAAGICDITDEIELKVGNKPYTKAQVAYREGWRGRPFVTLRSLADVDAWAAKTAKERKHGHR